MRLASGSDDNTVKVWDAADGRCLRTIEAHQWPLNACAWSHDGSRLLSASDDGTVKIQRLLPAETFGLLPS